MLPGGIKAGGLVAYAGRAGVVRGVELHPVAGDALAIEHTASPRAVVFVPLHRVAGAVKPISAAEAREMDANIPDVVAPWSMAARRAGSNGAAVTKTLAARRAERLKEFARLGGLARAEKVKAGGLASGRPVA